MKKLLCLLLIFSTLTTFANSVALPLNTAAVESSVENEDTLDFEFSEDLENAYTLLKQFVAEQKESGNQAFYSVDVYTASELFSGNDNLPEEYQNKLFVCYSGIYEDIVPVSIEAFMQENGIDKILVTYIRTLIMRDPLGDAYTLLKQFVEEQKESGNYAFNGVQVYTTSEFFTLFGSGEVPEEYQNKVMVDGIFWGDEETVVASIKSFMQENGLDENLITYMIMEDAPDTGETSTVSPGDVNEDGNIDVLDVIAVNKAILGKASLTDEQLKAIDFNGNGRPDPEESLMLLKYIVGLIDDFTME